MLLTPDLNHPSIVQLSSEYRSCIGCLYHKSLQRSKLIVTTSFGWSGPEVCSGGLLQRSATEVCSRVLLRRSAPTWRDLLGLSLGLRVVDCHYLLLINWRRYTSSAPLGKALSNRLVTMGRSTCKSTPNLCRSPHCGDVGL
ncbi:hypothetical protein Tco_0219872 [Tanacetum coccineum]